MGVGRSRRFRPSNSSCGVEQVNPRTAKTKGRETENLFVEWVRDHGVPHAERRRLNGSADRGDVGGWPGVCVEIKSGARTDIAGWLQQLKVETDHAGADVGFVAVRPKGQPHPSGWYAVMPLPELMRLLVDAGWACAPQPE